MKICVEDLELLFEDWLKDQKGIATRNIKRNKFFSNSDFCHKTRVGPMTQTWFHDKATEIFQNKNDSHFLSVRLCKYMMYMIWDIFLDIVQQKLSRICIEKKNYEHIYN